jgi:hypothetical protein
MVTAKICIPLAYLAILGIAMAYQRQQLEIRALLLLCVTDFVLLALFNVRGKINYFVHVMPLLTVLAVLLAWRSQLLPRDLRLAVIACCAVLLLVNGARLVHSVRHDAYRTNYLPVQRVLRALIPPEATVFAQAEWAFALGFERVLHDDVLGFRSGTRLDYLVIDGKQQYDIDIYSQTLPGFRRYSQLLLTDEYALVHQDALVRIYHLRPRASTAMIP